MTEWCANKNKSKIIRGSQLNIRGIGFRDNLNAPSELHGRSKVRKKNYLGVAIDVIAVVELIAVETFGPLMVRDNLVITTD